MKFDIIKKIKKISKIVMQAGRCNYLTLFPVFRRRTFVLLFYSKDKVNFTIEIQMRISKFYHQNIFINYYFIY